MAGDYAENVKVGIEIVVDKKASAKAKEDFKKQKEEIQKAGDRGGGGSSRTPGDDIKKAGEEADKSLRKAGSRLDGLRNQLRVFADGIEGAFGRNIVSDWLRSAEANLDSMIQKSSILKRVINSFGADSAIGKVFSAMKTAAQAARFPLLRLFVSARRAIMALAGPIGAVAAAFGILYYQLNKYRKETKEAEAESRRLDKALRDLKPSVVAGTDRFLGMQNQQRAASVAGAAEGSGLIASDTARGAGRFADAYAKIVMAQQQVRQEQASIASMLAEDERVTGSKVAQLEQQLSLKESLKRLAEAELQIAQQQQRSLEAQVAKNRELIQQQRSLAQAGQAILEQQKQQREGLREQLGRLSEGKRNAGLRAFEQFEETGDLRAGKRAERILGLNIESVGKAAAATTSGIDDSVIDRLGKQLDEKQRKAVEIAERLAGGSGLEAVTAFIERLAEQDKELNAIVAEQRAKLTEASSELIEDITAMMDDITEIKQELAQARYDASAKQ